MVPRLEQAFSRILQIRGQLRDLYRDLDDAGMAPDDDEDDDDDESYEFDPSSVDPIVVRQLAVFRALLETLRDDLEELAADGVMVKDLDHGLVDFYAHHQGRDVLLCWRLGEREVSHWHEIEAGYRGRRPVDALSHALLPTRVS